MQGRIRIGLIGCGLSASTLGAEQATRLSDPVSYLGDITASLVVVVALIVAGAWLFKQFAGGSRFAAMDRPVKIVSTTPLGTREKLALVEVGDEQFVIGITPGRIEKLHTMSKPLNVADARETASATLHPFAAILSRRPPEEERRP